MIIVKYTFLFFIFLGVSFLGNLISKKYKNRIEELRDFKEACNILESKIRFTYEPLGDIFQEISKILRKENRIYKIFENSSFNMKKCDFKTSWEKSIDEEKTNLNLKNEDINLIKGLSNMLGKTDMEGQLSEIDLTMSFLDNQILLAEEECRKNEKMYRSLGTIFGLAIIIILI